MATTKPQRWEWPEGATRVSDWLTPKDLRELTGDKGADRGTKYGRVVYYRDGRLRRQAAVERRATTDGESGKWRYRLVDASSLRLSYVNSLDLERYTFKSPELGLKLLLPQTFELTPYLLVYISYDPDHIEWLKAQDAKWEPNLRAWYFQDEREFDALVPKLKARFGVGQEQRYLNVTLSVEALLPTLLLYTTCTAFSRKVLRRDASWHELIAGEQVRLVGELGAELMLVILQVPSTLYAQEAARWGAYIRDVQVWSEDEFEPAGDTTQRVPRQLERKLKRAAMFCKRSLLYDPQPPELGAKLEQWLNQLIAEATAPTTRPAQDEE